MNDVNYDLIKYPERNKIENDTVVTTAAGRQFRHLKGDKALYPRGASSIKKDAIDLSTNEKIARVITKIKDDESKEKLIQKHNHLSRIRQELHGIPHRVPIYATVLTQNKRDEVELISYQKNYRKGDLFSYEESLSDQDKLMITTQILETVDAMHERRIYHRDLKPHNILLDYNENNQPTIAITDFELSCIGSENLEIGGTVAYMSPEEISTFAKGKKAMRIEEDLRRGEIWSLGMTLYELWHEGNRPDDLVKYLSDETDSQKESTAVAQYAAGLIKTMRESPDPAPYDKPKKLSEQVIWQMLQYVPSDRISPKEALAQFKEINSPS